MSIGAAIRVAAVLVSHPALWATAVREARLLVLPAWWRRFPPLPVPSRSLYRFRLETAYGTSAGAPPAEDLLTWLRWCRSWHRAGLSAR